MSSRFISIPPGKISAAIIQEVQSSGTDGGTFNSGSWVQRVLNTLTDPDSIVLAFNGTGSTSSNQFELQAGSYIISVKAPGFACARHKVRLTNVTDGTYTYGTSRWSLTSASAADTWSELTVYLTLTGTKVFQVDHQCTQSNNTNGLGVSTGISGVSEYYTTVEVVRVNI